MPAARIPDFDTWRPGYGAASVTVLEAGTTTPADIFSDEELTIPLDNPQTLAERILDGISYGKFTSTVYVSVPFSLDINSVDQTGVTRIPIVTLEGQDAGLAVVTVDGGSEAIALEAHLARRIDVRDFGEFLAVGDVGASRATNTTTLTTAIGVAGGRGAARVFLPAGTYQIANFTLPTGVVLEGEGKPSTILQSNQGGVVATIGGNDAGFARLTLDGVTQVALSVGVNADNRERIVMDDVLVKRFETGIARDGGKYSQWRGCYVSDCVTGAKDYATDDELSSNFWQGGIELCSTLGLDLRHDGEACVGNRYELLFDTNTSAASVEGAKATVLEGCVWIGNTTNLVALDDSTANQIIGLEIIDGSMDTGALTFTGRLENVAFRRMRLTDITVTITTPTNTILVEDCEEDSAVISGAATNWLRNNSGDLGASFGLTPGSTPTKAWAITLNPGDHVILEGKVIGRQINADNRAFYHFVAACYRPGSALAYDTQTGNFTKGNTLTGATSGATATIQNDSDSGATGTLTLVDIIGDFVDNEIITDGAGGSATANGTLTTSDAIVSSDVDLITPDETNAAWAASFVANGPEIELRVTGAASAQVEWTSKVDVMRN